MIQLDPLGSWALVLFGLGAIAFLIHRFTSEED